MDSDKAHIEKSPSYKLSEVGLWVVEQIYKASSRFPIYCVNEDSGYA